MPAPPPFNEPKSQYRVNRSALVLYIIGTLVLGRAEALTIDAFDSGQVGFPGIWATGANGSNSGIQNGSMLGGTRDIRLQKTFGSSVSYVTVLAPEPTLSFNNGTGQSSRVTVNWNGAPGTDLTDAGLSKGFFLGIPLAIDHPMSVTISVSSATGGSSLLKQFPKDSFGTDFYMPFSLLTGTATLTAVTGITLVMESMAPSLNADIDFFNTTTIPIPGTLALLGLGIVALARRLRLAPS